MVMLGERLKSLRTARNMNQTQLAARLGVARSVVSFYESGDRSPSYEVLIKMAGVFNVSTDFLLGVERTRTLDVSGLTEEQIAVVSSMVDSLRNRE